MRRTLSALLVASLVFIGWPAAIVVDAATSAVGMGGLPGSASGAVETVDGLPVAGLGIRARDLDVGGLVASALTDAHGRFEFAQLTSGNYLFEAFDQAAGVVGTSSAIALAPGANVEGVAITVPEPSQSTPVYVDDDDGNGKAKLLLGALAAAGIALGIYALVEANDSASDDEITDALGRAALTGEPTAVGHAMDRSFVVTPGSCVVCPPATPRSKRIPTRPASPCR